MAKVKANKPVSVISVRDSVLADMLVACEVAGDMARADREHKKLAEDTKGKLWNDFGMLAHKLGYEAFKEHWNAIKPDLKKPENADKFGAELITEGKNKGDYRISHYLTEVVSRLNGAMKRKIKLVVGGKLRPMNKLADQLSERVTEENEASRREKDPLYDERQKVSKGLVSIAETVRKGSHAKETLAALASALEALNEVLKTDGKKVKATVAKALAAKPTAPASAPTVTDKAA